MSCVEPSCFVRVERRARKAHVCVACDGLIAPGTKYSYSSGVWDGQGRGYKQCLRCAALMERVTCLGEDGPGFGGLADWLQDVLMIEGRKTREEVIAAAEAMPLPPSW